jgi:hypothetical protein
LPGWIFCEKSAGNGVVVSGVEVEKTGVIIKFACEIGQGPIRTRCMGAIPPSIIGIFVLNGRTNAGNCDARGTMIVWVDEC